MNTLNPDILIIGGGIAGLWTLYRLKQAGFDALLVNGTIQEQAQTPAAQGIIHSGLKYALHGRLSAATQAIAAMPQAWQQCLQGTGDVDLRAAQVLSPCQYLWTEPGVLARLTGLLASTAVQSHCERVPSTDFPTVFQNAGLKGNVYRLHEPVLDVPSVIRSLVKPYQNCILNACVSAAAIQSESDGLWQAIQVKLANGFLSIKAKAYVLAAGNGNADLLARVPNAPKMQQRPLHMVVAQLPGHYACYAHCVDGHINPKVTITTHPQADHTLWYMGGEIAESGVTRDLAEQIKVAHNLMQRLLPGISWQQAQWHTFRINRAEVANSGKRPQGPFVKTCSNVVVTWPTKMAFAPVVANDIVAKMQTLVSIKNSQPTDLGELADTVGGQPPWLKPFDSEEICNVVS